MLKVNIIGDSNYIHKMLGLHIPEAIRHMGRQITKEAADLYIKEITRRVEQQQGKWPALSKTTQRIKGRSYPEHRFHKWIESGTFIKQVRESVKITEKGQYFSVEVGARSDIMYKGKRAKKRSVSMYKLAKTLEFGYKYIPGRPLFRPAAKVVNRIVQDNTHQALSDITIAWAGSVVPHKL